MLAPGMTSMAQVVGGDVVDLTAPTPPAAQSLASSATTASVTFTHPGAPAGVTYALTVTDEADAAVTPDSGSGLGAWVFPVASDKAYAATIEATGTDGQTSQSTALVKVAAAGGAAPGWDAEFFDLTDLDVATLTNGATTGVTRASAPVCDVKVVNYNSNNGVVSAGASGITVAGGGTAGSLGIGIDLEAIFSITVPDDVLNDCAITLHLDGLADWTGGTDAWEAGIMADNSANFTTGTGFSVRGDHDAVGQDRVVSTNNNTSNWALNEAIPAGAWVATILLRGGQIAEAFYSTGSTAPTGAALDGGGQVMARTIAAGSARWAASTFYASVRAIWRPNFVLTGVTLHTRRTA